MSQNDRVTLCKWMKIALTLICIIQNIFIIWHLEPDHKAISTFWDFSAVNSKSMQKSFVLLIVCRSYIFNRNLLTDFAESFHLIWKKVAASKNSGIKRASQKPYCLYTDCTLSVQWLYNFGTVSVQWMYNQCSIEAMLTRTGKEEEYIEKRP